MKICCWYLKRNAELSWQLRLYRKLQRVDEGLVTVSCVSELEQMQDTTEL